MTRYEAFYDQARVHGNVVVNWRGNAALDLMPFAAGYKNAAQELTASLERAVSYPDHRGYPILFLYRHALELYLKTVSYRAAQLMRLESELEIALPRLWREHSLTRLLHAVKPILEGVGGGRPRAYGSLVADIADFVADVDGIDPGSYSFRYPVDSAGAAAHPHHAVLNVLVFAERADAVIDSLVGACLALDHEFTETSEGRAAIVHLLYE